MTRDNVPNPTQPSTSVPAAIVQGVAQGAAHGTTRTAFSRLTEEFLADPPDWVRTLGSFVKELWQG